MGTSLTNQNYIQKEIERVLNSGLIGPIVRTWQAAPSQGYMAGVQDSLAMVGNLPKV
jgi:hypothetical protein